MMIDRVRRFFIISTFFWCVSFSQNTDILLCSDQCENNMCTCYMDGFVDCGSRNLSNVPAISPCSTFIEMGGNNIENIEFENFNGLSNVIYLNLSSNQIQVLNAGVFSSLTNLVNLNLQGNEITTINDCAFNGLPKLAYLQLQNNKISLIGERAFDNLPSIETLALFNNLLTTFHIRWFEEKSNLTTLTTGSNRWDCSCQLKQDYNFVIENHPNVLMVCPPGFLLETIFNHFCIQCTSPINLSGQLLHNIQNCSEQQSTMTPTTEQNNQSVKEEAESYCDSLVSVNASERTMNTTTLLITTAAPNIENLDTLKTWHIVLIALAAVLIFVGIISIFVHLFKSSFLKNQKTKETENNVYTEGTRNNVNGDVLNNQNHATTV